MCNWTDNFYSRIIPVFDAVKEGNYESRTMYDRRRSIMKKKELKKYLHNVNEAKEKTADKRKNSDKECQSFETVSKLFA